MDQTLIDRERSKQGTKPPEELIALYKERSILRSTAAAASADHWERFHLAERFEAIRQILIARGVKDRSVDLSAPEEQGPKGKDSTRPGFAIVGGLIGGLVGYLLGSSSLVSFGDVLTRGATLRGLNALLRPAAEHAFNYMLAGVILGVVGGLVIASLTSSRHTGNGDRIGQRGPDPRGEVLSSCPHCGSRVPVQMQFCGNCGKGLAVVICRQCGKAVPPPQQFCGACGTRIE